MKKLQIALQCSALLAMSLAGTGIANGGVVDVANVTIGGDSYRAFEDTTTNLVWVDLDNFFFTNHTYNSVVALLSGSGFHLANLTDLQALQASIPAVPANFGAEAPIVGGNYFGSPHATGSRELIWGIYEDGNSLDGISYSWKFSIDGSWNFAPNVMTSSDTFMSHNNTDQDLGAWIVADSASSVPEPGTFAIMGLGLAATALLRRKVASRVR